MNNDRRKRIKAVIKELNSSLEIIDAQYEELESLTEDEEEAFDSLPESIQGSDRGEEMEANIGTLSEQQDSLSTVADTVREIVDELQDLL